MSGHLNSGISIPNLAAGVADARACGTRSDFEVGLLSLMDLQEEIMGVSPSAHTVRRLGGGYLTSWPRHAPYVPQGKSYGLKLQIDPAEVVRNAVSQDQVPVLQPGEVDLNMRPNPNVRYAALDDRGGTLFVSLGGLVFYQGADNENAPELLYDVETSARHTAVTFAFLAMDRLYVGRSSASLISEVDLLTGERKDQSLSHESIPLVQPYFGIFEDSPISFLYAEGRQLQVARRSAKDDSFNTSTIARLSNDIILIEASPCGRIAVMDQGRNLYILKRESTGWSAEFKCRCPVDSLESALSSTLLAVGHDNGAVVWWRHGEKWERAPGVSWHHRGVLGVRTHTCSPCQIIGEKTIVVNDTDKVRMYKFNGNSWDAAVEVDPGHNISDAVVALDGSMLLSGSRISLYEPE